MVHSSKIQFRAIAPSSARKVLANNGFALVEQGTQSALNFATMFLISQFCGLNALGYYALGRFLILLLGGVQNSLISFPYTIFFRSQKPDKETESESGKYANAHLKMSFLFGFGSLVFFLLLTAIAYVFKSWTETDFTWICFCLGFATPMYLVREFSRRHEFAHLRTRAAMWFSVIAAVTQLIGLGVGHWLGMLTVPTAFLIVGMSCLITNLVWLDVRAREFGRGRIVSGSIASKSRDSSDELSSLFKKNWKIGKWIFSTQAVTDFLIFAIQSLLVFLVDATAGGIFAACFAVVSLCNPVIRGLSNLLTPDFAKIYSETSVITLINSVKKSTAGFAGLVLVLGIGVVLFGEHLVKLFYHEPIPQLQHTLAVLCFAALFQAAGLPAFHALNTIGQPRKALMPRIVGFISAAAFLIVWGVSFRELGAAYGLLFANLAIFVLTFYQFLNSFRYEEIGTNLVPRDRSYLM